MGWWSEMLCRAPALQELLLLLLLSACSAL